MDNKPAENLSSLSLYVTFSILMCIIFTIVILIMSGFSIAVPDSLITCFYALFGGEIVMCGLIKIFKLKEDDNNE